MIELALVAGSLLVIVWVGRALTKPYPESEWRDAQKARQIKLNSVVKQNITPHVEKRYL